MSVEAGYPLQQMLNMAGSPPLITQEHYCDVDHVCSRMYNLKMNNMKDC